MANTWIVRAGRGGTYADEFETIGIAAIGFGVEESACYSARKGPRLVRLDGRVLSGGTVRG